MEAKSVLFRYHHQAMPGLWFFLLVFVEAGHLTTDAWMTREDEDAYPSCDELRSLWNSISRSERTSEMTNEIPLVPWNAFYEGSPRFQHKGGRRKNVQPKSHLLTNAVQDIFTEENPPSVHHIPAVEPFFIPRPHSENNGPLLGHFGNIAGPQTLETINLPSFAHSPNPLLDTTKKGDRNSMDSESWGLPEDVGLFGRFLDIDEDFPLTNSRDRQGWNANSAHFGAPSFEVVLEPCLKVINKACTFDEQCVCVGWNTLKCIHGECNSQQLKTEKENEHGSWHYGPLPYSKLGRQKRLRRSNKFTFM
ncbi:hypothetical protein JTE90_025825 [Oedothorax gibbosus]|uniref:Secreted protein n=1 Tax=Oedothorax gibbosus TaxID=931172 RepID=A0AAV6UVF0_9ARAC|nr:hypothetical protein JTE90_025825 [Oedothorax gibbosus]